MDKERMNKKIRENLSSIEGVHIEQLKLYFMCNTQIRVQFRWKK